jgi:hypothetical protein
MRTNSFWTARHSGCVVLPTIAIIFGSQASQRLMLKLPRVRKIKKEHDKRQGSKSKQGLHKSYEV